MKKGNNKYNQKGHKAPQRDDLHSIIEKMLIREYELIVKEAMQKK